MLTHMMQHAYWHDFLSVCSLYCYVLHSQLLHYAVSRCFLGCNHLFAPRLIAGSMILVHKCAFTRPIDYPVRHESPRTLLVFPRLQYLERLSNNLLNNNTQADCPVQYSCCNQLSLYSDSITQEEPIFVQGVSFLSQVSEVGIVSWGAASVTRVFFKQQLIK